MPTFARRDSLTLGAAAFAVPSLLASALPARAQSAAPRPIRAVRIRDVAIGEGRAKTIVSLAEKTLEAALARAAVLGAMAAVDLVEYRIDHLDAALALAAVAASVQAVAGAIAGKPLVVTFRTGAEGGVRAIAPDAYAALYEAILASGAGDLFDIEAALLAAAPVARIKARIQAAGRQVVLSHHDFAATPSVEIMVALLRRQQALGADVCKLAVMPRDPADLLRLMEATWTMRRDHADRPLVTMAMGGVGAVSRLAGEVFGSALTFGALGTPSAPGQIEVADLRAIVGTVHDALA